MKHVLVLNFVDYIHDDALALQLLERIHSSRLWVVWVVDYKELKLHKVCHKFMIKYVWSIVK